MNLLLDNCVHVRARELFPGHAAVHASERGWGRLANGSLIARAAGAGFDALVTTDKKIRHEHNLDNLALPVVELGTRFVRIADLLTLAPHAEAALRHTAAYRFVSVRADGTFDLLAPRQPPPA